MKPKYSLLLFIITITITLSGCAELYKTNRKQNDSETITTVKQTVSSDKNSDDYIKDPNASSESKPEINKNSAIEAYKKVLQNKVDFYSTENREKVYLNDFLTNNAIYGATFEINHFAVLDMDGDKIPEVVLGLTVDEDPSYVEVLHYMNNEVYGYFFGRNQLCDLKADGTFRWLSGGVMYNGYGKLKFQNKSCEVDDLAYLHSKYNDESYTTLTTSYYINNKLVNKELYQSFIKEEAAKKDVKWYEFSQENIETELSANT